MLSVNRHTGPFTDAHAVTVIHTHTHTHARTHARKHARTHAHILSYADVNFHFRLQGQDVCERRHP